MGRGRPGEGYPQHRVAAGACARAGLRRRRHRLPMRSSFVASMMPMVRPCWLWTCMDDPPHKGRLGHQPPLVETTTSPFSWQYAPRSIRPGSRITTAACSSMVLNPPTKQHHANGKDHQGRCMEQPFETASKAPTLVVLNTTRRKRSLEQIATVGLDLGAQVISLAATGASLHDRNCSHPAARRLHSMQVPHPKPQLCLCSRSPL